MKVKAHPYRAIAAGCVALLAALLAVPSWAAPAGKFIAVVGDVQVVDQSGRRRAARSGEALNAGDTVVTRAGALAQLRLADGGLISVRAETHFTMEDFSFESEADGLGRMFINLVKGSLRSLTGLIGRRNPSGYRIKTPHATIGVRGTDHETFVITTPQPGGYQPGTFDWCFEGRTIMQSQAGAVVVAPQQVAYVSAADLRPRVLPEIPDFLRSRVMAQPQVRRGEETPGEAAVKRTRSGDAGPSVSKTLPKLEAGVPKAALEKQPVLINPLLSPISPSATSEPKLAPSQLQPIAPQTKTISPTLETAPTTTTISPTLETAPTTTISPTPKTVPSTTTISPTLKAVPSTKVPPTIPPSSTTKSPTLKSISPETTTTVTPK